MTNIDIPNYIKHNLFTGYIVRVKLSNCYLTGEWQGNHDDDDSKVVIAGWDNVTQRYSVPFVINISSIDHISVVESSTLVW